MTSPLIVALDVPERVRAVELAVALQPYVAMVKVGLEAFVAHGPSLVETLRSVGVDVFLDLKLHDIPRTVEAAAREAARLDPRLVTVHAAGGADMIKAARAALPETSQVIAVTVLTSLRDADLGPIGFAHSVATTARGLGKLALAAGADGLVCSAHELAELAPLGGCRVVPGVRPAGSASGDQARVASPAEAVRAGATWIVVGRPIIAAPDPVAAAQAIVAELRV